MNKIKFKNLSFPLKCATVYGLIGFWIFAIYIVLQIINTIIFL